MLPVLLAAGAWGIGEIVIAVILIAAVVAILFIAVNAMGVQIPNWVVQIFWVVVIAVVAILAIRFLLGV